MNRRLSVLLAWILCAVMLTGGISPALAETVNEAAAPGVEEVLPEGTVEFGEPESAGVIEEAEAAETALPQLGEYRYGRIAAEQAEVTWDVDGAVWLTDLTGGDAVLVISRDGGRAIVAFDTPAGVQTGFIDADALAEMTDEEENAFLDALAASGEVALYGDDLNYPLALLDVTVADAPAPLEDALAAAEPAGIGVSPASIAIGVGEYYSGITATLPDDVRAASAEDGSDVTWSSDDTDVVQVDPVSGAIYGVSAGRTVIVARAADGEEAFCEVEVAGIPGAIALNPDEVTLGARGQTCRLSVILPEGTASGAIVFLSTDPDVATVSADGVITAKKAGSATVTAWTYNGKGAACYVTVTDAPKSVSFASARALVAEGQSVALSAAALTSKGAAASAGLTYYIDKSSADAGCVALDPNTGVVTGLRRGSAKIGVRTHNGVTAKTLCEVEVVATAADIHVNQSELTIGLGEVYRGLSAELIAPEGEESCAAEVTWATSDASVVNIDPATGAIYGADTGTATVVAQTQNGKWAAAQVTVLNVPGRIALNVTDVTLGADGQTCALSHVLPAGTASGAIVYLTTDANVATVDENGVITSKAPGEATITAWTYNGKGAACHVQVTDPPKTVEFTRANVKLAEAQSAMLQASAMTASGAAALTGLTYYIDNSSADSGCVTLNEQTGEVTGVRRGSALIGVKTHNGVSAKTLCKVEVVAAAADIRVNTASVTIGLGEAYSGLSAELIAPEGEDSCAAEVTWTTGDASVVNIDPATGLIYGARTGAATVYASTHDGKWASVQVMVLNVPSRIVLNASEVTLGANGQTFALSCAVPSGTASGAIVYLTTNANVATVDEHGVITSKNPGEATITAWTYNGRGAACYVTVTEAPKSVSFVSAKVGVAEAQSAKLEGQALTASGAAAVTGLTYYIDRSSADPGCVTLDENTGVVTGVRKGSAMIGVRTHNGLTPKTLCRVEVVTAAADIRLNVSGVSIGLGEVYRGLEAELIAPEGEDSCAAEITWTTSDASVVNIDPATGAIYGARTGTANVYASTHDGKWASAQVTVLNVPARIALNASDIALGANGQTFALTYALPGGTASGKIVYLTTDANVATVDENGVITSKNPGEATVTAWTYNGRGAACRVKVTEAPKSVAFTETKLQLAEAQTKTAAAQALTSSGAAAATGLTYYIDKSSADPGCVVLDEHTGAVTGVRKGSAVIGVKTHNGVSAKNLCTVQVLPAPAAVTLNVSGGSIGLGEYYTGLKATLVAPEGETACYGELEWLTSNSNVVKVDAYSGAIYGARIGSATIYVRTQNGKYAACSVTVKYAPTYVTISPASGTLVIGETGQLRVGLPSGTASAKLAFVSSAPDVVSVDDTGCVKALSVGTATVAVWTYNGKAAGCTIQVRTSRDSLSDDLPQPVDSTTTEYDRNMGNSAKIEYLIYVAQSKLGRPYVYGSFGPDKFDCSGFTHYCFRQVDVTLKESAYTQGYDTSLPMIKDPADLKRGDLVFFNTVSDDADLSDHAGIYLGNGYFIHASSGAGKVIVSNLASGYYSRTYSWGRRVFY